MHFRLLSSPIASKYAKNGNKAVTEFSGLRMAPQFRARWPYQQVLRHAASQFLVAFGQIEITIFCRKSERMPPTEETLNRLAIAFTVKDIMTPSAGLVCAANDKEAGTVSDKNPDFDVIPIQQDGTLIGYFERKSGRTTRTRAISKNSSA